MLVSLFPNELHRLEQIWLFLSVAGAFVPHVIAEDIAVPVLAQRGLPGDAEGVLVNGGEPRKNAKL